MITYPEPGTTLFYHTNHRFPCSGRTRRFRVSSDMKVGMPFHNREFVGAFERAFVHALDDLINIPWPGMA